ncbi:hypothetical protein FQR65_LT09459 [Abscondita terminalis]|nr:hypothetical protein FQR65_LT09459 [Abscondita terminalis]
MSAKMEVKKLFHVEYEIYGKVQGVYFRKHTEQQSKRLNIKGWCKNTKKGTVLGVMEGEESKINIMKNWLENVGSPASKIEKAEFKNEKTITNFSFNGFSIKT